MVGEIIRDRFDSFHDEYDREKIDKLVERRDQGVGGRESLGRSEAPE